LLGFGATHKVRDMQIQGVAGWKQYKGRFHLPNAERLTKVSNPLPPYKLMLNGNEHDISIIATGKSDIFVIDGGLSIEFSGNAWTDEKQTIRLIEALLNTHKKYHGYHWRAIAIADFRGVTYTISTQETSGSSSDIDQTDFDYVIKLIGKLFYR
jgi:hypothetical protein